MNIPSPLVGEGRVRGTQQYMGLSNLAKNLRKQSTNTERLLWRHLKAKQLQDFKFRRQQPIGNYIVDFVCFERKVVVELDGGQHADTKHTEKDKRRDILLRKQGYKVLRFWDNEVWSNLRGVIDVIREKCEEHPPLTPPIKGGE
ncbi:MAG TPA: endonuclease domain-containing protein [Planctomycetota bacterium]|nr:endonuclease domain-containing protein [Planctomycetota bacterium]